MFGYIEKDFVPVRGINRDQCPPLVPVGATNRDQMPLFSSPKGGKRRLLVQLVVFLAGGIDFFFFMPFIPMVGRDRKSVV